MILYFTTTTKTSRLAIDTERKTFNDNYYYLGQDHNYICVPHSAIEELTKELDFNCYEYDSTFLKNRGKQ